MAGTYVNYNWVLVSCAQQTEVSSHQQLLFASNPPLQNKPLAEEKDWSKMCQCTVSKGRKLCLGYPVPPACSLFWWAACWPGTEVTGYLQQTSQSPLLQSTTLLLITLLTREALGVVCFKIAIGPQKHLYKQFQSSPLHNIKFSLGGREITKTFWQCTC